MAAPSAWVTPVDIPLQSDLPPVEAGEADYLLVDYQVRVARVTESYTHIAERLVSQAALDRAAQISLEIDPEHDRVRLHEVRVIREGRAIDKLADSRRSLLNREESLEQGLINGRVTLHVLLQDVRVGDVLDYSYTVERRDPVADGGYSNWFNTRWGVPVRRFRLRILNPADRPLEVRDHGKLAAPIVFHNGAWTETAWEGNDIPALQDEDNRPAWFVYYPHIEISELANWNDVRTWTRPLYVFDRKPNTELQNLIGELKAETDEAERILHALRFVQDDIRYTGLEIGAGAYRPSQPAVVLARRYGDCKDKVFLFVTLMRALGVEAYPALVHSRMRGGVTERVPSPGAFDHVIAKVRFRNRDYWLDATTSAQGGTLDTLVQADFRSALVIDDSADGLVEIPARKTGTPGTHVVETYDFKKGRAATASFDISTVLREADADSMRSRMRCTTVTALGKEYFEYYRKKYPGLRVQKPLVVKDERTADVYTIDESYEIDTPFEKNDVGEWKFTVNAYLVTERTVAPAKAERHTPLERPFPLQVRHEIVAYLPATWKINDDVVRVKDPAFEYESTVRFRDGRLDLQYDLRNTSDHVTVPAFQEFTRNLAKANDAAYFTFTEAEEQALSETGTRWNPKTELAVVMTFGLGLGVWLAWLLARSHWRLPEPEADAPQGLSGWMVLPVLGVLVSPFVALYSIWGWFRDFAGASQLGGWIHFLMMVEFLLVCSLLIISLCTAWLMLHRRRTFPVTFIFTQALGIGSLFVDDLALWLMRDLIDPKDGPRFGQLVFRAFIAALWIAYMLVSQRVRATFVMGGADAKAPGTAVAPAV
jgi:transglutaminase-like putative cysteine protease